MSHTVNLINQLQQASAVSSETTHRLVSWVEYQVRINRQNDDDIRDLDKFREQVEQEFGNLAKEGKRKREETDEVISQLVAAVAVLEGQVKGLQDLVQQQQGSIQQAQTIATRAIKRARFAKRQGELVSSSSLPEAGPSTITIGHPLTRTCNTRRSSSIITIRSSREPSIEFISRPTTPSPESQRANLFPRPRTPYAPDRFLRNGSPIPFTELID